MHEKIKLLFMDYWYILFIIFIILILTLKFNINHKRKTKHKKPEKHSNYYSLESDKKTNYELGLELERYVGYLYENKGFNVVYTGACMGKNDMGRDLVIVTGNSTFIIQCKRWSKKSQIHENVIFQLYGSLTMYQKEHPSANVNGVIITTSTLSDKAKKSADALGITVYENFKLTSYPQIKCKEKSKYYYLPNDAEYDRLTMNIHQNDLYVYTEKEAKSLGFIHISKHNKTK